MNEQQLFLACMILGCGFFGACCFAIGWILRGWHELSSRWPVLSTAPAHHWTLRDRAANDPN